MSEKLVLFWGRYSQSSSPEVFRLGVLDSRFLRAEHLAAPGVGAEPRSHPTILLDRFKFLQLSTGSCGDVVGELVDVLLGRVYAHVTLGVPPF